MKRTIAVARVVGALSLEVMAAAHAQAAGSRDGRIDGSSVDNFETSVVALQNALAPRRREAFEAALAIIWLNDALGPGGLDLDGDGDVDVIDGQALADDTSDLLLSIQRGDLLSAIEKRARRGGSYSAADYMKQLDGLGYSEIVDLGGRPDNLSRPEGLPLERQRLNPNNLRVLNDAGEALSLHNLDDANTTLRKIDLRHASPYERSKTEQLRAAISFTEGDLGAARNHLQNAIGAGGLNADEVSTVLVQVRYIESTIAASRLLDVPSFPE
jgi:hypothetical protein